MTDFMLRTDTQDQIEDALIAAGLAQEVTDPDGEVMVLPVSGVTIDHIGPIPAQVDPEDPAVIVRPGDSRWHTNVRVADGVAFDPADLPEVDPAPAVPYRVFFD